MKLNDFKLERFFAKYEFNTPYLLCCSDCESFSVEELFNLDEGAERDFKKLSLGYTESLGNPELREEISKLYNNAAPDGIIVFAGAEEGIFIGYGFKMPLCPNCSSGGDRRWMPCGSGCFCVYGQTCFSGLLPWRPLMLQSWHCLKSTARSPMTLRDGS